MSKYTIISDGKRISMFDRELGVDLSLKNYILNYHFSTIVNKVGIFATADNSDLISELENYFQKIPLPGFQGPVIFLNISKYSNHTDEISKYIYRIEERDNIVKAVYNDDFFYLSDEAFIKINKGLHFAKIMLKETRHLIIFIPYLIKIMEGLIIENHLKLGYFPIHSAVVECEDGECVLIMGNSQSGKTTTAQLLCESGRYRILSDDIAFIDGNGYAYPFGHYRKIVYGSKRGRFSEQLKQNNVTIYREISKIANSFKPYKIKCIMLPQIMCIDKPECFRMNEKDILSTITLLLGEYPNQWFLYSDYNDILGFHVMCMLIKNPVFRINLKFRSKNHEITKMWEDQCFIL